MSEIIANKKIVISAEDRVTSVIAKTNEAFDRLENHLSQIGVKFNEGSTEQSSYRASLNATRSTADETDVALKKLNRNIKEAAGTKDIRINAETTQADSQINRFKRNVDQLKNNKPIIKARADTSQAENGLSRVKRGAEAAGEAGKHMVRSFALGGLIANGIQSAANSLVGFAKEGFLAAEASEQMTSRWKSFGMTAGEIRTTGAAVRDLKENTDLSGQAAGNLVTRMYGLTGSTQQAIALSKGVGSIADQLHLSGQQADNFAGNLNRIEASGKVTSQSLGRLEKQAPGLGTALQRASGMSKQSFDALVASGKMTSSQLNDILLKASANYRKNANDWEKTSEGAAHHLKATWKDAWQALTTPLVQSAGTGLGALSKSLETLRPEFVELGAAVSNLAKRFAEWLTPQHARDIGTIVGSLGHMAAVIGKGVWKVFAGTAELLGKAFGAWGGHGDTLDKVANALDHISKNKAAMAVLEGVGAVLTVQFAYGKLVKVATGLGLINRGISDLSKAKISGHLFTDMSNGLKKLRSLFGKSGDDSAEEFSTRMERNLARHNNSGMFSRLFKGASKSAESGGDEAGSGFISRMLSKIHGANVESVGRGIGSKLGGAVAIAFGAVDLFKALEAKKDRAAKVGKSIGTTIGGVAGSSVGATLGSAFGPLGTILGGLLGGAIGGSLGGKLGETIGKAWKSIEKGATAVGKFLGKVLVEPFKLAYKAGEWLGSKISGLFHHNSSSNSSKEIKSLGGNHYSKQDIANIRQMNSAVRAYTQSLRQLKSVIKHDDPTKQLRSMSKEFNSMNPALQRSAKYWKALAKPVDESSRSFKTMNKSLAPFKAKNNPLDRLGKSVEQLSKDVKRYQFGKELAKQMEIADKSMSGKHSFVGQFKSMTQKVISELHRFRSTFNADWRNTWDRLDSIPSRGLSQVASTVSSRFSTILSHEHSFTSKFLDGWKSWISSVVSSMRSGFDKLPSIAQKAMSDIVSRLNRGISAINSVISDFGGDKRLSAIHYARGTFFHPGGKAVLNDGLTPNKTELVWQPSKGWGTAQGQYVVRDLEAGSMVMDAPHSKPVLDRAGDMLPHYDSGTLSDAEQDKISEEFMNNPVKASRDLVLKVTNWNSNVPVVADLGKATAIGFSRAIANVLKDLLGIIKEPVNGDWTPVIKSAAHLLHFNISAGQIAKLLRQIQTESGGREVITNHWDSNAAAGHPSQGLLQFIPSTFQTWAVGKYRDINKGFDQILAAINCLNHGGEGGWGNIGNGHGWANGGEITSQQFGWVGDNDQHHEFVINPYNANALPLLTKAWAVMSNNHPEWRSPNNSSFNSQMIALMQAAVASINNIDLHPSVSVEAVAKPVSKYEAKSYAMLKGGR